MAACGASVYFLQGCFPGEVIHIPIDGPIVMHVQWALNGLSKFTNKLHKVARWKYGRDREGIQWEGWGWILLKHENMTI